MQTYKLKKRICQTCGKEFQPKCDINIYCSRKCFKKAYYHRKKGEELNCQKYPEFKCPKCGLDLILDFNPVKNTFKWDHYECPGCNSLMITISERIVVQDRTKA